MRIYYSFFKKFIPIFLITLLLLPCCVLAIVSEYVWSSDYITTTVSANANENSNLNLESGGAVLIEQNSGKVLYDHNMHEKLRPASVTKVMTILLIMEAIDSGRLSLEDKIPCSENASSMGGSQIWLDVKETLSVHEMLKAICVVSANDYNVQLWHKKIKILKIEKYFFNFYFFCK